MAGVETDRVVCRSRLVDPDGVMHLVKDASLVWPSIFATGGDGYELRKL